MTLLFESQHPLVKHKLTALRDVSTDHRNFRELVRELSMLLCYEATQDMTVVEKPVTTPMGQTMGTTAKEAIGLVPIMRAGIGMTDGIMQLLPNVQVWHIGLYRDEETLRPVSYYNKLPKEPTVQICLILDPMLATGGSAIATANILKEWGVSRIKYVGLLAAPEGVEAFSTAHPDIPIHIAHLDERLNDIGFIVPGLGDAGDRMFGT
ncbi:MAG: uracil phosphoribosyltransferase [Anaerolineae bacterium]|nr:uracil phosphoribosyltransferase [Anaerolineae bacterium]MCA9890312.1 uracil phosphoribosyltransferase [Anaerolineae bacterium]